MMEKFKGLFSLRRKQPQTTDNLSGRDQSQDRSGEPPLPNPPPSHPETEYPRPSSENPPHNPPPLSSFPDGVDVLYDCSGAAIDICFVHGLTGNRDSTWTAHGQSTPWPKKLLPPKL